LQYRRISSYFSKRRHHPILKIVREHNGVDFAAPLGTPVVSVGEGHVIFLGWKGGYGKLIIVNHPNSFATYYGHLLRIKKGIVKGSKVVQGQVIGNVGSTGLSTGPHLHFGIKKLGRWINPLKVDLPPAEPINEKYREIFKEEMKRLNAAMLFTRFHESGEDRITVNR
jgi:murein DD-endopeptidase MepM/ murein hydrolase activator NlpD